MREDIRQAGPTWAVGQEYVVGNADPNHWSDWDERHLFQSRTRPLFRAEIDLDRDPIPTQWILRLHLIQPSVPVSSAVHSRINTAGHSGDEMGGRGKRSRQPGMTAQERMEVGGGIREGRRERSEARQAAPERMGGRGKRSRRLCGPIRRGWRRREGRRERSRQRLGRPLRKGD